jgi:ubiquinone/menaquinone biosynthesis C-methylase UbiE
VTAPSQWDSVLQNFTRNAPIYNRVGPPYYTTFAERLVDLVGIRLGASALDVCCGTGAVTLTVARRVGPNGRVLAVDLTPAMLERAVEEARTCGATNVDFRRGDVTRLELPAASFDVVTCGFGIQFLPDPAAAVAHWTTFLVPGGRLGCSTWSEGGFEPLMTIARELLAEEGIADDPYHRRPTSNPANLTAYARAAGLVDVECYQEDNVVRFTKPGDAVLGTPRGRNVLNVLPPERRDAVRAELIRRLEARSDASGLALTIGVLYLTGRKPAASGM